MRKRREILWDEMVDGMKRESEKNNVKDIIF